MSTSIGSLNVDVTLELARMDAQFKELQSKTSKNMTQLKRQFKAASADADKSLGGIGRGGGGGGGFIRKAGGAIASKALGKALGLDTGVAGGLLRGAGSLIGGTAGGAVSGVGGAITGTRLITGWAKESERLDDAALAAMRYGETFNRIIPKISDVWSGVKNAAITGMGIVNELGEFAGSGFDAKAINDANNSERAAVLQEQALAKLRKENDPAKLAATRASITQFQRDQRFAGASPKEQQRILSNEITSLKIQEDKARASKKILDAENIRLERLRKEAELQKLIGDQAKERQDREATWEMEKNNRIADGKAESKADRVNEFVKSEKNKSEDKLANLRDQLSALRDPGSITNPFSNQRIASGGFGTASDGYGARFNAVGMAMQGANQNKLTEAQGRIQKEMLEVLKYIQEGIEEVASRIQ